MYLFLLAKPIIGKFEVAWMAACDYISLRLVFLVIGWV